MAIANNMKRAMEVVKSYPGKNPNTAKDKKGPVNRIPKGLKTKIAPGQFSINSQQKSNHKLRSLGEMD